MNNEDANEDLVFEFDEMVIFSERAPLNKLNDLIENKALEKSENHFNVLYGFSASAKDSPIIWSTSNLQDLYKQVSDEDKQDFKDACVKDVTRKKLYLRCEQMVKVTRSYKNLNRHDTVVIQTIEVRNYMAHGYIYLYTVYRVIIQYYSRLTAKLLMRL